MSHDIDLEDEANQDLMSKVDHNQELEKDLEDLVFQNDDLQMYKTNYHIQEQQLQMYKDQAHTLNNIWNTRDESSTYPRNPPRILIIEHAHARGR